MRKNKEFWCVVLVIGLVTVLSVVSPLGVASEYSTFEDYEFARWAVDKSHTYGTYCELKSSAAESQDYDTLELLWGEEYDFCQDALIEIDQFYVSKEMRPLKNEFQLFLQYLKLAAYNAERWYESYDPNARENSIKYSDRADEHYNNFSDLYENWRTTKIATPTPIETPTPTLTLIPSPLPVYTASPSPTLSPTTTPMPGFNFLFAIIGVLVAIYLIKRRA